MNFPRKTLRDSKTWLPILFLASLLYLGKKNGALILNGDPLAAYGQTADAASSGIDRPLGFRLRNVSDRALPPRRHYPVVRYEPSYVAVSDYNRDGRMDFILVRAGFPGAELGLDLLRNAGGQKFVRDPRALPLENLANCYATAAQFFDYDNDGWEDLFIGCLGRGHMLFRNLRGRFVDVSDASDISKLRSNAVGVTVFDHDNDGFLDLYLSNYSKVDEPLIGIVGRTSLASESGGRNMLLKNRGGRFEDVAKQLKVDDPGHSWITGAGDFDNNGYADLYVANDFGFDQVYLNFGNLGFRRATSEALGRNRSYFSMSAEVADVDNNGQFDVYVSNAVKPGLDRGFNRLWMNPGNSKFRDIAGSANVSRCGWAWGTKFLDLNRDGRQDLVVVNGLYGRGGSDKWYFQQFSLPIPQFYKTLISRHFRKQIGPIASGHQSCVFLQTDAGEFVDIAVRAGLKENSNNRGLALIDYDNDGGQDLLISNLDEDPFLYKNEFLGKAEWIGINLVGSKSNRSGIGAVVRLKTDKQTYSQAHFPSNGYSAQKDPRLVFSLPENERFLELAVSWPSGARTVVREVKKNEYFDIREVAEN